MNFRRVTGWLASLLRGGLNLSSLATAGALGALALGSVAGAQTTPPYVIYNQTTVGPAIQGAYSNIVSDKFGNVFVGDSGDGIVYEYPANGSTPTAIFTNQIVVTGTAPNQKTTYAGCTYQLGVSGVAVDASNNLYVTTRYDCNFSSNPGGITDIFKFPYSNNGYPAPYTYTGAYPGQCTATSTSVCAYGQILAASGYYYQPQGVGFDASGNGYLITTYDTHSGGGKAIFECAAGTATASCAYGTANGTVAVDNLPTKALSLAVASNGDLYWADGLDVYFSKAGSGTFSIFDTTYETSAGAGFGAQGVSFDAAGNLYVQSSAGVFEVPSTGGTITSNTKFLISTGGGNQAGPAIDSNGNVYQANYFLSTIPGSSATSTAITKSTVFNGNLGSSPVGTATAGTIFTVYFNAAGTVASLSPRQTGGTGSEYALSADTCTGTTQTIGSSCNFTVTFTPAATGIRRGSVVLTDSTGALTTLYLTGVGLGTGISIDPGVASTVTSTLQVPAGVAIDTAGNVFVADAAAGNVYEYAGGAGTPTPVVTGLRRPTGVAIGGASGLYVVDQAAGTLSLYKNTAGTFSTTATPLVTGLTAPTDVVVASTGQIYVSNTGANEVRAYPNYSRLGSDGAYSSLGTGLSAPSGVAVDASGNLYVADTGNNRVVQLASTGAQITVGTGLSAPTGVAVEASGAVLIADQGNGRLVRVPNEAGTLTAADQVSLPQPLLAPYTVRLSSTGTVYVDDNTAGTVDSITRTTGLLNFGSSNVNATSAAQSVVVSSTGTSTLTLGSPFFTAPAASTGFTLTAGTSGTACAAGTLTNGFACTLSSTFTPTTLGTGNAAVALNTMAANDGSPSLTLAGTGVQLNPVTVTLAQTAPSGTITYGVPVVVTATVAGTGATPTGTVRFTVDGQTSKPVTLVNGAASYTITGLAGSTTHTVIATYSGDGVSYASGSSTTTSIVVQAAPVLATLTVTGTGSSPLSAAPTDTVSFSVALTPTVAGSFTGTVNFVSGSTVIGTGTITGSGTTYTASYAGSLAAGTYQVQAVYAGNGNYAAVSSAAEPLVIVIPSFTVASTGTTLTATANSYGTTNLTVTSYSGFQGGVALSCTGLPANAYCEFRPGLISLLAVGATIPPITTQMQIRVSQNPVNINSAASFGVLGLISAGLLFLGFRRTDRRKLLLPAVLAVLAAAGVGSLSGCSNNVNAAYPTPAGTYTVTLHATGSPLVGTTNAQPPTSSANNYTMPVQTYTLIVQ